MDRKGIPEMSDSTLDAPPQTGRVSPKPSLIGTPSRYRQDHSNPVNHFLHVGVGWPMAAIAVILLPFRPLWGIGLFALAYAIMFFGHFVFERNTPTIFKDPTTPFVVASAVIRRLLAAARIIPARDGAVGASSVSRREN
jgi:hypothetical protein